MVCRYNNIRIWGRLGILSRSKFLFFSFSLRWVGEWIIRASTKWSGAALIPGLVSHMCNSFIHQCCVSSRTAVMDWTIVFNVVVKWLWLFDVCKFYLITLVSCLLPSFLPGFLASLSDQPTCYLMWSLRPTAGVVQQQHSGFVILFANMDLPETHLPAHSPLKHSLLFQTPACLPTTLLKVQYSVLTGISLSFKLRNCIPLPLPLFTELLWTPLLQLAITWETTCPLVAQILL